MSGGRWKYREERVTVGENSMTVRQLTAGERRQFAEASAKIRKGEMAGGDLPAMLLKFASIEPRLTSDEDVAEVPPELLDEATQKILELTGLTRAEVENAAGDQEKKEPQAGLNS